jgi:hypothetical protein
VPAKVARVVLPPLDVKGLLQDAGQTEGAVFHYSWTFMLAQRQLMESLSVQHITAYNILKNSLDKCDRPPKPYRNMNRIADFYTTLPREPLELQSASVKRMIDIIFERTTDDDHELVYKEYVTEGAFHCRQALIALLRYTDCLDRHKLRDTPLKCDILLRALLEKHPHGGVKAMGNFLRYMRVPAEDILMNADSDSDSEQHVAEEEEEEVEEKTPAAAAKARAAEKSKDAQQSGAAKSSGAVGGQGGTGTARGHKLKRYKPNPALPDCSCSNANPDRVLLVQPDEEVDDDNNS